MKVNILTRKKERITRPGNKKYQMKVLYQHIRLDTNEVFYVGIGNINRTKSKESRSKYWKIITNETNYKVEIILENLSFEEACKYEKILISLYGRISLRNGSLCNITEGGEYRINKHSEETKQKISRSKKNLTEESRQKMSQAKKGDKHFMYGKSLSEEHKRNLSKSQKGKKISIETLQKIRNTNTKKKEFKEFFDMLRQKDPRQIFIDNFKRKRDL